MIRQRRQRFIAVLTYVKMELDGFGAGLITAIIRVSIAVEQNLSTVNGVHRTEVKF